MIAIIMCKILLVLCFICLSLSFYILYRNDKVRDFKIRLNNEGYDALKRYIDSLPDDEKLSKETLDKWHELDSIWDSINEISYDKMLYSFKPLKPEYWLNEEQLKYLGYERTLS